jgi:hypothetical protein
MSPEITAVRITTGIDHEVTATSRPKNGFSIIAVGSEIRTPVATAVTTATIHLLGDQRRRAERQLGTQITSFHQRVC